MTISELDGCWINVDFHVELILNVSCVTRPCHSDRKILLIMIYIYNYFPLSITLTVTTLYRTKDPYFHLTQGPDWRTVWWRITVIFVGPWWCDDCRPKRLGKTEIDGTVCPSGQFSLLPSWRVCVFLVQRSWVRDPWGSCFVNSSYYFPPDGPRWLKHLTHNVWRGIPKERESDKRGLLLTVKSDSIIDCKTRIFKCDSIIDYKTWILLLTEKHVFNCICKTYVIDYLQHLQNASHVRNTSCFTVNNIFHRGCRVLQQMESRVVFTFCSKRNHTNGRTLRGEGFENVWSWSYSRVMDTKIHT